MTTELEALQGICTTIIDESAGVLQWSWDDFMGASLAVLEAPATEAALEILGRAFGQQWTAETIGDSVEAQAIAHQTGGLRPGQRLFLSNAGALWLVGTWWPWNNGAKTSLRIGLIDQSSDSRTDDDEDALRGWFGV